MVKWRGHRYSGYDPGHHRTQECLEEELRKSENQFKVLIDNLSSGVALVDEQGKFTIYNPAFLQMFGLFEDPSNIKNVNDQNWSDWQVFGEDGTVSC